jgi:hypothetical protein
MNKRDQKVADVRHHALSVFDGAVMAGSLVERAGKFVRRLAHLGACNRAGRAWADSNHSVAEVEAVAAYIDRKEASDAWDKMCAAIGDDDAEFNELYERSDAFIVAWYRGVAKIAAEWKARR